MIQLRLDLRRALEGLCRVFVAGGLVGYGAMRWDLPIGLRVLLVMVGLSLFVRGHWTFTRSLK